MSYVFIAALAERADNGAAIDLRPNIADRAAVVPVFELLFPLMQEWSRELGPEFTVYAMRWTTDSDGRLSPGYLNAWESFGCMYRLDRLPGGYVKVSDYSETDPYWRPIKGA